jgi:hypothetical protein
MFISAELRWFWRNDCPQGVREWFEKSGKPPGKGEQVRVDRYYHSKGNVDLGMKVRDDQQGKVRDIEVKGLVATRDLPNLGLASRHMEIWCKWKAPPLTSSSEIVTEKVRSLRKFDAGEKIPSEIPLGPDEQLLLGYSRPATGCNIELTDVAVRGRPGKWYSLCFEAFADDLDSAPDALVRVIEAMKPLPKIDGALLSYPAWLDTL